MRNRAHRLESAYPALWRAICGAVRDAATCHPDIQIPDKRRSSIVKRAVGNVLALNGVGAAKAADKPEAEGQSRPGTGAHCNGAAGLAHVPASPIPLTFHPTYPGGRILLRLGQHNVGAVFPPWGEGQHRFPWVWRFWLGGATATKEGRAKTEQAAKNAILAEARDWLQKAGVE